MDEFNYLSVLISIVLGLGITQLVTGLGRLVQARRRVRTYWPAVAWVGLLFLIHVQSWWAMFGLRGHRGWSFADFLLVLLQPVVLYLLAALVLPDFAGDAPVDLRANYYANTRWFFGLDVALLVVSVMKDLAIDGALPDTTNLAAHAGFLVVFSAAAATEREWYHKALVPVTVVGMAGYIALLFAHLD